MKPLRLMALLVLLIPVLAGAEPVRDKPLIGITTHIGGEETERATMSVSSRYIDAVTDAGGLPIVLPAVTTAEDIERFVKLCDGFVFSGGADINPAIYGQEPHETWNPLNPRREYFDLTLMKTILDADKPVLGICLGMQELTVASGGTLIQDIPSQTDSTIDHRPGREREGRYAHDIEIVEGTMLHALIGMTQLPVNSAHHQAADTVGEGVVITARSPDGIIEGIEIPAKRFAVGVQWHPEGLSDEEPHLNLFRGLVRVASQPAAARLVAGDE